MHVSFLVHSTIARHLEAQNATFSMMCDNVLDISSSLRSHPGDRSGAATLVLFPLSASARVAAQPHQPGGDSSQSASVHSAQASYCNIATGRSR